MVLFFLEYDFELGVPVPMISARRFLFSWACIRVAFRCTILHVDSQKAILSSGCEANVV